MSNNPFIKGEHEVLAIVFFFRFFSNPQLTFNRRTSRDLANYPHHEGIWGWEDAADQVVMMIRNIRRSMVDYHDILWDIG